MSRSTVAAALGLCLVLLFATSAAASTPTISYSIDGIAGTNGWYRGSSHGDNVVVHWSVSLNATSTTCLAAVTVPGPTAGKTLTCSADNSDGHVTAVTRVLKIDATPPTGVTAHLSRGRTTAVGTTGRSIRWWKTHLWHRGLHLEGRTGGRTAQRRRPAEAASTGQAAPPVSRFTSPTLQLRRLRKVREQSTAAADIRLGLLERRQPHRVRRAVRGRRSTAWCSTQRQRRFTDQNINPGTRYVYSVQSFDEAGNASRSFPSPAS
jgi:hypothetical protein